MRIIVSGGGTGGHIYPAVTIIDALRRIDPTIEFLYVGTKEGLEADIIPKEGLPFVTVDIAGFRRSLSPVNIWRLLKAGIGVLKAVSIVRDFKPDAAVGTGGYVCGPILLAAALSDVPCLIQEQNTVPGVTNKILARFVKLICAGTADAVPYFPPDKTIFTGNPIRQAVMEAEREAGQREFHLDPAKKTVLVSGGSRGARSMNRAMLGVIEKLAGRDDVQVLHVTGKTDYKATCAALRQRGIEPDGLANISVVPYVYKMPLALAAADLAVFRAGAIGIAELTARGIPAILIPFPYATANHQEHNARAIVEGGAGRMILDRELTEDNLLAAIEEMIGDDKKLQSMSQASQRLGRPQAAQEIAALVLKIADRSKA